MVNKYLIMKPKISLLLGILFIVSFISCKEDIQGPLVETGKIPEPPTNIRVDNLPGGAKITYTLPNDPDVLYVYATFTSRGTEKRVAKSSVFQNYVVLDGFAEEIQYDVQLRSVTRSEALSAPVDVKINPLRAPIKNVFETLKAYETFGGVYTEFTNEEENEYVFYTLIKDSVSENWIEYERYYTDSKERQIAIRGFDAVPTDFAFFFKDKWSNLSDTLFANFTPLYEEEMDKSLWKDANLADDSNLARDGGAYSELKALWGDNKDFFFQNAQTPNLKLPNWFTIDMGRKYLFSRINVLHVNHGDTWLYSRGAPLLFEIWATNTPTTNWDDWTLMGEFESVKPSGLPLGELTQEDRDHSKQGDEFDFILRQETFRYFRFKTLKTWGGQLDVMLLELTLYGQPSE